jgi:large repetitive protein
MSKETARGPRVPRARVGVLMVGAVVVASASACPAYGLPSIPGEDDDAGGGGAGGAEVGGGDMGFACEYACPLAEYPPCRKGVCDEKGQCLTEILRAGTPCDDGAFCTVDDACNEVGVCEGIANDCGLTAGSCEAVVCDEARMSCSVEPIDPCP